MGELVAGHLAADRIDVRVGCQLTAARRDGADTVVELDDGTSVRTDVVVLGAGRRPATAELGLPGVGVAPDPRGALVVDGQGRVTEDGLWAVGDVTRVAMFTHVAQYQGRVVADTILGKARTADYTGIPRVVFADPEIAAVGLTRAQAQERGLDLATAEVDLAASLARPWTYQTDPSGTLALLADREREVLVGAWAVAPMAGEWIHQAALAIRARVPVPILLDTVAQFPTFSQGFLTALEAL